MCKLRIRGGEQPGFFVFGSQRDELTAILPKLRTVALEQLPKLEKQLDTAGIMHTPGRLPQLP